MVLNEIIVLCAEVKHASMMSEGCYAVAKVIWVASRGIMQLTIVRGNQCHLVAYTW